VLRDNKIEVKNMEEFLKLIFSEYGLIAGLFTALLWYTLKQNNDRELRYLDTIDNLTVNVSDKINVIEDDVKEIKELIK